MVSFLTPNYKLLSVILIISSIFIPPTRFISFTKSFLSSPLKISIPKLSIISSDPPPFKGKLYHMFSYSSKVSLLAVHFLTFTAAYPKQVKYFHN
ncbi:membrane protein [Clostridium acetobutylicum EA 2018]|uniref:Predicted membrane protein n=1 Tax=Clostridium acetobutylicum (strain ATCC 824 / DSM 792 / JCM 1419 / IAM 19013 / LMG 5710 / NBRC 13948 / NRRL B-527 / VKM B-1787 / 2291 / W) TaxID=272562 RepID=Q97IY6_CLOAB|nr:Predicted membrane protein [Clostridium acetobutylicum ATCC 824]ADZ20553.1 membrane protein [Clostridium acetobutylicum EA 2018]AEI31844.1 hypothetical protein SMB_G1525 [Clostridium acetobutylicum DSM 1731]AWV81287.1 hypothetical protein DK921_14540 [Clostridium acetobutylicum]PSM04570.1 hypothetical protein C7T89_14535 [Clostridium sp. NJ4]